MTLREMRTVEEGCGVFGILGLTMGWLAWGFGEALILFKDFYLFGDGEDGLGFGRYI